MISPFRHGLRRATSPGGGGKVAVVKSEINLAPPLGELSFAEQMTEGECVQ